jgi:LPXTG-motif cell wall-anchored protein
MATVKLRHVVGTIVLTLFLGGMVATTAAAQYPPTVGAGRVSRSELKKCQCTQFSGDGFAPGSSVSVVDVRPDGSEHVVATVTADAKGEFRHKVCFDQASQEGTHTLVARGTDSAGGAHEDRAVVVVKGTVCYGRDDEVHGTRFERGSGGLPRTGSDVVLPALLLGLTLVVAGSGIVYTVRRRRAGLAA